MAFSNQTYDIWQSSHVLFTLSSYCLDIISYSISNKTKIIKKRNR